MSEPLTYCRRCSLIIQSRENLGPCPEGESHEWREADTYIGTVVSPTDGSVILDDGESTRTLGGPKAPRGVALGDSLAVVGRETEGGKHGRFRVVGWEQLSEDERPRHVRYGPLEGASESEPRSRREGVSDYVNGDRVSHERYGLGTVLSGRGSRRVSVTWDDEERGSTRVLRCNLSKSTEPEQ